MIILAHLLDHDSYGYEINKDIMEKTGGLFELKEATLYTSFKRLEENGCIVGYWGDETTGSRRRYYSLTNRGRAQYEKMKEEWRQIKQLLDTLLREDLP